MSGTEKSGITHDDLVEIGRRWMSARSPVVVTEISSGVGEEPDVIGFSTGLKKGRRPVGYGTVLIECKASRSDFLSDKKKYYRRNPEVGLADYRLFLCPTGLIKVEELPEGWGLLETQGENVKFVHIPSRQTCDKIKESALLVSVIRRLDINPDKCVSLTVNKYQYETKNKATLTVESNIK